MRIIEQSHEVLAMSDLPIIEQACRTAYQSESKGDPGVFVKSIVERGHESVIEHSLMTVRFVTDRGVTHELVRHRLASFTQESTRYCNYALDRFGNELTFIKPVNFTTIIGAGLWNAQMAANEKAYIEAIEAGEKPEAARSMLPNSLKTTIVMTANFREWRHVFSLRCISKRAHPQMRALMRPLYDECRAKLPEIFDMGEPE